MTRDARRARGVDISSDLVAEVPSASRATARHMARHSPLRLPSGAGDVRGERAVNRGLVISASGTDRAITLLTLVRRGGGEKGVPATLQPSVWALRDHGHMARTSIRPGRAAVWVSIGGQGVIIRTAVLEYIYTLKDTTSCHTQSTSNLRGSKAAARALFCTGGRGRRHAAVRPDGRGR